MTSPTRKPAPSLITLKQIVENTSSYTGKEFFEALVQNLAEVLDAHGVWVTEFSESKDKLRALAFWLGDHLVDEYEYQIKGTPCAPVLTSPGLCHIPDRLIELFPDDPDLEPMGGVSYMGLALKDVDGEVLGHLALMDNKPMDEIPEAFAVFKIFASRAAAEVRRLRSQSKLIESESKLSRLVNGSMDAIIELNDQLMITQANDAAIRTFEARKGAFVGKSIGNYLNEEGSIKIRKSIAHLSSQPDSITSTWIPDHLICLNESNQAFPAEATLSKYAADNQNYFALYIRNVKDRIETEQELKMLNVETAMLREKVDASGFSEILGQSRAIMESIELVHQVAPTDSTVLILGETGTGKELFARAIHGASRRKDNPMITLNCAALPPELIESELFGHVKGAFTGATASREGRFSLADKGTLFLDEIAELPLQLQAKLLRVLQEGEFDPVGSSRTQTVDVRVIAATNRELEEEIQKGTFREDLYYRLNVFPMPVPPLRDRGEDIILIAEAFALKYAKQMGKHPNPLTEPDKQRLLAYHWPGNVRELQNLIERSIITSTDGGVNLATTVPQTQHSQTKQSDANSRILTESELREIEVRNIKLALEKANGKISGKNGAAALLQIPATTLNSRIKALGIS